VCFLPYLLFLFANNNKLLYIFLVLSIYISYHRGRRKRIGTEEKTGGRSWEREGTGERRLKKYLHVQKKV
jgi:hypothetical protein